LLRARACAHAARCLHDKRRKGLLLKTRKLPIDLRPLCVAWRSSLNERVDVTEKNLDRGHATLNNFGHTFTSYLNNEGSMIVSRKVSQRPDWTPAQIEDFQFYIEVFGSSVKAYSLSGFFNIVVPCLAAFDLGIRTLLLAIASMHRTFVAPRGENRRSSELEALERFNSALLQLSSRSNYASADILQTSSVLFACWHTLRLDSSAATGCIRVAQKLCRLDARQRFESRLISARNATDSQTIGGQASLPFYTAQ
jgi:hypothetical protein